MISDNRVNDPYYLLKFPIPVHIGQDTSDNKIPFLERKLDRTRELQIAFIPAFWEQSVRGKERVKTPYLLLVTMLASFMRKNNLKKRGFILKRRTII